MPIRMIKVVQMLTVLALCAGSAAAGDKMEIYGMSHEVISPRDAATVKQLDTALRKFEREIAGKRGGSAARSSKPREIVVVGSKVKDVVRSSPAPAGGFSDVSGLSSEVDPVEYRSGGPASLPQLQVAIRRFEAAAGTGSPCVRGCKANARRCMVRCRGRLSAKRIKGRCICDHIQARCLIGQSRQGKCTRPHSRRRARP